MGFMLSDKGIQSIKSFHILFAAIFLSVPAAAQGAVQFNASGKVGSFHGYQVKFTL